MKMYGGYCSPVVFPVCGGLNEGRYIFNNKEYSMMQHGFARFKEFEVEALKNDEAVFLLKSNDEIKEIYPFDFEFRVGFKLKDKKLYITYSVKNVSDDKIYFSFGGHEGYACPEGAEEYIIKFENDDFLIRHMLSGGFFDGKIEEIKLRIGFPEHNTLAIWTLPSRKYVCIEPWCGVSEKKDLTAILPKKTALLLLMQIKHLKDAILLRFYN